MDTGTVPEQFAVILILDRSADLGLDHLRQLIMTRIRAVSRLRQRLIRVPPGYGRPVWVDDHDFDIDQHVHAVACQAPGDERALLDTALSVIMSPLPREHPLWSAMLITYLADAGNAVVVVLHHVLADGLGGLNVLAARRSRSVAGWRTVPSSVADTKQSCSRCLADAGSRATPGGRVLAVAAASNVSW